MAGRPTTHIVNRSSPDRSFGTSLRRSRSRTAHDSRRIVPSGRRAIRLFSTSADLRIASRFMRWPTRGAECCPSRTHSHGAPGAGALSRTAAQSPHLLDLISLVKGDVESSGRFPLRRGGPDTPRSLGAWKSRYNHLDRYVASKQPSMDRGQDVAGAQALSAAEYEGWPLGATQPSGNGR